MPLRVLCVGGGYACHFAGWVLAREGASVEVVAEGRTHFPELPRTAMLPSEPAELEQHLADVDVCITDDVVRLEAVLGGPDPWPASLRALTLVDIGRPAAEDDANAAIASRSGVGATIGEADGPGFAPPARMLEALVGLGAASGALAGWLGAQRDGRGEHVQVDPVHHVAVLSGVNAIQFLDYGLPWRRSGRSASGSGGPFPFRMFACRDGWVVAICRSLDDWTSLIDMLGNPRWSSDPEYADPLHIARHHADTVAALITEELSSRTVADVVEAAKAHRVPLAPLRTIEDARADTRLFPVAGKADPTRPVQAVAVTDAASRGPWAVAATSQVREPRGPLHGLRVLDLGWVWAAPIAAAWLADLGADVVKVESPARLDLARRRGVEFPSDRVAIRPSLPGHERAWLFNAANRNKRSLVLDLKQVRDRDRFLELVSAADVMIESFSAGVLERLQVSPDVLMRTNPTLLLLSMGGRAVDGEYVSRSYAPILSALAGIEGEVVDAAGAPLGLLNWGVADPNAGCWGVLAVLAALARGESGRHLVLSQLRALVNTCVAGYHEGGSTRVPLAQPEEVTAEHLAGRATGPLGQVYREVVTRSWTPDIGERRAMGTPWRFRRMPVEVRRGAPTLGDTSYDVVREAWRRRT